MSYRDAGVGHREQEELNRVALEKARLLNERLGVGLASVLGYATGLEHRGTRLSLHMDGVGTKTLVLERLGRLWVAGWDCVAMNANDLAVEGYRVIGLADYVSMPRPSPGVLAEVLEGVAEAASRLPAPLIGGETAVLPGLVSGVDVVCAALGEQLHEPRRAAPGDVFVGVSSTGLHANGYSLVRRILDEKGLGFDSVIDGVDLAMELSKPTALYHGLVLEAYSRGLAVAAAHLTGGGWAKLLRMLPGNVSARLRAPEPPPVFGLLQRLGGVDTGEMYRVFNMGVGLVLAAPGQKEAEELLSLAERSGYQAWILGRAEPGPGGVVVETPGGVEVRLG